MVGESGFHLPSGPHKLLPNGPQLAQPLMHARILHAPKHARDSQPLSLSFIYILFHFLCFFKKRTPRLPFQSLLLLLLLPSSFLSVFYFHSGFWLFVNGLFFFPSPFLYCSSHCALKPLTPFPLFSIFSFFFLLI